MIFFLLDSAKHLKASFGKRTEFGRFKISRFRSGECRYEIFSNVRGQPIQVIGSILPDPQSFFDLAALTDAIAAQKPKSIELLIPYLAYARQDRPVGNEGALGVLIARILNGLPVKRISAYDLHSDRIRNAMPKLRERSAIPLFAKKAGHRYDVVVSPDKGGVARAKHLASLLRLPMARVEKTRPKPGVAVAKRLVGRVKNRRVLVVDDMIDTGGTIVACLKILKKHGARSCDVMATHGILFNGAVSQIIKAGAKRLLVTDALPVKEQPGLKILHLKY
jgi:ribose-phosphate pyrophosphokinase